MQGARTLDVVASAKSFASLLLPQHIEQALREAGFRRPSPVQEAALPLARLGTDLIVQAKAGTGKTLVFAVAAVERVDLSNAAPQVLVLAPTREIALQASEAVALVAAALPPPGLACGSFIGGLPVQEDEKQLRRACHVAVGTTGRVLSLIQRGALRCDALRMLVLDEADKLLGDSFRKDLLAIAAAVPSRRQTIALSATFAPAALDQLRRMMKGRQQELRLCVDDTSLLGVRQCYRLIGSGGEQLQAKVAQLLELLSSVSFQQAVVFCKYTADAEAVAECLLAAGFPAAYLSGQRTQLQRIEALNALRDFRLRVAVSTDLAARGVDLDRVNLVVNLELPADAATYMHRVGRAGRFGTRGVSVTLLEGPEQLARLQGYLQEVAGGQVVKLPDVVPEEWYSQPVPAGTTSAATSSGSAAAMASTLGADGPDTPAGGGGLLAASLAAGSLSSGGGPLADIATASLWLGDEEEEGEEAAPGVQADGQAAAAAAPAAAAAARQEWDDSAIEVSYQAVPKPAVRGALAAAAAAAPTPASSTAAAKPAVSSLTAAVAAAEASQHRRVEEAVNGCSESEDSWASTSDDEYSGSSASEAEHTAVPQLRAPATRPSAHPLRRNTSSASMGSSGSSGSSSGSGRLSSPPAPIPGRSLQQGDEAARLLWQNSYDEGGRLADVVDAAEDALAGGENASAPQGPRHCRGSSGSGDDEPSFRDSWLTEEQQQAAAAEKQRARAEAAAEPAVASPVELRPHRRSAALAAARPAGATRPGAPAARLSKHSGQQPAAKASQPVQQQSLARSASQQQREQKRQGHYWDVVRSVELDVRSRLASGSAGSQRAPPAASTATAGTAVDSQPTEASAPGAEDDGEDGDEGFASAVPRQRRPLGSAQLSAARRRQEEAAASLAAEAAALEMMAGAEGAEEDEEAVAQPCASAASATAAAYSGPADGAAAAAATAAAAEQQRQWSEFWMQHYAYYGCYPSEGLFSAGQQAAAPASEAAPPTTHMAGAAPAASATLPPPPPSPPAPPPMLLAAAWACQPSPGAEPQPAEPVDVAAAGSSPEGGWVSVPAALLARYQQLEWQNWHRQYSEWQSMWEQYKQYWHALYDQQQQLEQQQYQQQEQYQQHPH